VPFGVGLGHLAMPIVVRPLRSEDISPHFGLVFARLAR
jgi:hypothetical protein